MKHSIFVWMVVSFVLAGCSKSSSVEVGAGVGAADSPSNSGKSAYPGGKYTPPEASYGVKFVANNRVRMSDGISLSIDVSYPTDLSTGELAKGPFPVLITQDGYQGGVTGVLGGGGGANGEGPNQYYTPRGYIYVHMNTRGSGATLGLIGSGSEGSVNLADPRSSLDGVELAYWAASSKNLPASNGKIGLQGCSALGIAQLASLNQLGKLLKLSGQVYVPANDNEMGTWTTVTKESIPIVAAVPACMNGDFYRDSFFDNGIPGGTFALFPLQLAFGGVNTSDINYNYSADQVLLSVESGGDYGYDRQFYQERNWIKQADNIARTGVPLLLWTGWNEPGGIGGYPLYAALQNSAAGLPSNLAMKPASRANPEYQLIVGDWGHGGGLDSGIELEWFDTWIKGTDTGLKQADQPIHLQELPVTDPKRWVNVATYPMTNDYSAFYLAPNGELSPNAPKGAGSLSMPWAPVVSNTFTVSQPFTEDMTLIGPAAVRVYASSSGTNMQIFAQLVDVAPDGSTSNIAHGDILGSRHHLDADRSWVASNGLPTAPYLILNYDDYLTPGEIVELDIPIQPNIWRLPAGHKLQLFLSTQMPLAQCGDALITRPGPCLWTAPMLTSLPGTYTLSYGPDHPSVLNVPLVPSASLKTIRTGATPTSAGVVLPLDWGGE